MIDIINLQRKVRLDLAPPREYVAELITSVGEARGRTFSVAFISDRRMLQLNQTFRGKDTTTDVLSFPHEPADFISSQPSTLHSPLATDFLGDIVISAEQAQRQASENGLDLETEIKQLILHGLLHLCGYDHETDKGEMDTRELELREQFGI